MSGPRCGAKPFVPKLTSGADRDLAGHETRWRTSGMCNMAAWAAFRRRRRLEDCKTVLRLAGGGSDLPRFGFETRSSLPNHFGSGPSFPWRRCGDCLMSRNPQGPPGFGGARPPSEQRVSIRTLRIILIQTHLVRLERARIARFSMNRRTTRPIEVARWEDIDS